MERADKFLNENLERQLLTSGVWLWNEFLFDEKGRLADIVFVTPASTRGARFRANSLPFTR
jgi:hypothetical protein